MEAAEIFGKMVSIRLAELDWNKSDLAKALGIEPTGISKVLNEARAPRIDTLLRWAKALQTTPNFLLGFDSSSPAEDPRITALKLILAADRETLDSAVIVLKGNVGDQGEASTG